MRQFVNVEFKRGSRAYSYHNDGEPVAVGDRVLIAGRSGVTQSALVVSVADEVPAFETKPIICKADNPESLKFEREHYGQ